MVFYATCDLQMLRGQEGEYVIKEFSVFDLHEKSPETVIFAAPYSDELIPSRYWRQNNYVTQNIHGLHWYMGRTPYDQLEKVVQRMTWGYTVLYVKGEEKKRLLQNLVKHARVINIEEHGCPKLAKLPVLQTRCISTVHTVPHTLSCAAHNAVRLGLWLRFFLAPSHRYYNI
jgi:hypothetical protein